MHWAAAAPALFVLDIDDDLDPRQMRWQGAAVALHRFALARRRSVGCRFALDDALSHAQRLRGLFQCQLELIRVELLRTRAVAVAHQLFDDQLQLLDFGIGRIALGPKAVALGAQGVALTLQPRHGAGPFLQHCDHGGQPRLQQDRILCRLASLGQHAVIISAIARPP